MEFPVSYALIVCSSMKFITCTHLCNNQLSQHMELFLYQELSVLGSLPFLLTRNIFQSSCSPLEGANIFTFPFMIVLSLALPGSFPVASIMLFFCLKYYIVVCFTLKVYDPVGVKCCTVHDVKVKFFSFLLEPCVSSKSHMGLGVRICFSFSNFMPFNHCLSSSCTTPLLLCLCTEST